MEKARLPQNAEVIINMGLILSTIKDVKHAYTYVWPCILFRVKETLGNMLIIKIIKGAASLFSEPAPQTSS